MYLFFIINELENNVEWYFFFLFFIEKLRIVSIGGGLLEYLY